MTAEIFPHEINALLKLGELMLTAEASILDGNCAETNQFKMC